MASNDDTKERGDQLNKFRNLARDLECNESEEAFERALKRVASAPPKDEKGDD